MIVTNTTKYDFIASVDGVYTSPYLTPSVLWLRRPIALVRHLK